MAVYSEEKRINAMGVALLNSSHGSGHTAYSRKFFNQEECMWYHAIAYYGSRQRYWWNRKREDLIEDVVIPFSSQQVRVLKREGNSSLFNFGAADYITLVMTEKKLKPVKGRSPVELKSKSFLDEHCVTGEFVNELRGFASAPRMKSIFEQSIAPSINRIFVVMQFDNEITDSAYSGVIQPLGKEFGYDVVRVDEIEDSGSINQQILENISSSALVIADLTGERPNCYYEAGFAHAIGKQIIFTIKHGSKIHFDLAGNRFINWRTESDYRTKLRKRLDSITSKDSK